MACCCISRVRIVAAVCLVGLAVATERGCVSGEGACAQPEIVASSDEDYSALVQWNTEIVKAQEPPPISSLQMLRSEESALRGEADVQSAQATQQKPVIQELLGSMVGDLTGKGGAICGYAAMMTRPITNGLHTTLDASTRRAESFLNQTVQAQEPLLELLRNSSGPRQLHAFELLANSTLGAMVTAVREIGPSGFSSVLRTLGPLLEASGKALGAAGIPGMASTLNETLFRDKVDAAFDAFNASTAAVTGFGTKSEDSARELLGSLNSTVEADLRKMDTFMQSYNQSFTNMTGSLRALMTAKAPPECSETLKAPFQMVEFTVANLSITVTQTVHKLASFLREAGELVASGLHPEG